MCQQIFPAKNVINFIIFVAFNEIMWLSDCGLVHKVSRINAPNIPLKAYREKFTPEISIRSSMADYSEEIGLINLPLYAIDGIE